ncbi:hypothetical protein DYQ86_20305 [Acidobacteria bacterium AB60]|nr:hypothetical protein DYQ86_20305 [Acidobacteria bacterium AB60]
MNEQGTESREQGTGPTPHRAEFSRARKYNFAGPLLLLLAAAVATVPLRLYNNFSCGHDFDFHLLSWLDALRSWRQGLFYPHWTASANYGAGEPRFLFYPPLTWMLGALLGTVFSWDHVPFVLTFLLLAATGFSTRALARLVMTDGPATLAGCFALFSGYALFTVYERSAYAELAGGFWIPILLLLILKEGQRPDSESISILRRFTGGSALPIALVVAGAWLSNAPVGVMASYLLAGIALVLALLTRSWTPLLRSAAGALLGLGLAAFYLVPAAWEQRWVAIRQATDDPGLLIENSFLFGRHHDPALELHDIELWKVSGISVAMIAVAAIALLICWRRRRLPGARTFWIPLALIPLAVLLLQFPLSLPVWNLLPKLRFLQFPWRWLLVVEAPMAIFVASALWAARRWVRTIVVAASSLVFLASAAFAAIAFHQSCAPEDSVLAVVGAVRAGRGYEGTDEYAPRGADNSLVAMDVPAACLVANPAIPLGSRDPDLTPQWTPEQGSCLATYLFSAIPGADPLLHKRVVATTPQPGFLVLRLREYPAWRVQVNGDLVLNRPVRDDGLMAIPVPSGSSTVTVDWTTTPDVLFGRWISASALLLVTGLPFGARFRRQTTLK